MKKNKNIFITATLFLCLFAAGYNMALADSCSGTCYPVVCPQGTSSSSGSCSQDQYVCCGGTATNYVGPSSINLNPNNTSASPATGSSGSGTSSNFYVNQEKIPGAAQQTGDVTQYVKDIVNFGFAVIGILAMFMLMIGA
ncbi:MAG: hypothetical protein WC858_05060, partial [Parcubacteria group bacterium]